MVVLFHRVVFGMAGSYDIAAVLEGLRRQVRHRERQRIAGVTSTNEVPRAKYDELVAAIQGEDIPF